MTERQSPASRAAQTNGTTPAVPRGSGRGGAAARWVDDRVGLAGAFNTRLFTLRKVFPDHWSFMFGEIALWSFVVLLVTGTFLTFWFDPSMARGPVPGFVRRAARDAHVGRVRLDPGHLLRRPRWAVDAADAPLGGAHLHRRDDDPPAAARPDRELPQAPRGQLGHRLPDAAPRHPAGLLRATRSRTTCSRAPGCGSPTASSRRPRSSGTYLSFFLFGGEFPGEAAIPRLYIVHVLLLLGCCWRWSPLHLILVFYHKHTQWPGPGRTERNVVGYPFFPVYAAKTTGFFLVVFGVIALMGGLLSINPVWKYGPYDPSKVTAGSQPDWYLGFVEGALRIMPGWETHLWA